MRTDTATLIRAMRILARDIQSGDGVANAAIAEAADRMEELAFALREHLREEFYPTIPDTEANLNKGVEFMASAARDTLKGTDDE